MFRTSKEIRNNSLWDAIAAQLKQGENFDGMLNRLILCHAPPPPSVLVATLRLSGHRKIIQTFQNLFTTTVLLLCTSTCLAERADRGQPLHIEADQVQIDDLRQTSTFTGNVKLAQGTMLIRGQEIVVVQHKDGSKQTVIHGNTASFRQKREGLDEYVEGYGERIEYDTRAGTVDFYVRARVKRELDEVRGDHIAYNLKTEIFQVNSNANTVGKQPNRVRAVLRPKSKRKTATPAEPGIDLTPKLK